MDKEVIKKSAYSKMGFIEDRFSNYLPPEVQQFYLLQTLIANGTSTYIESYGLCPLDKQSCNDGKVISGFGVLNDFERDCINYLNEIIEMEENKYERKKQISLISHR